MKKAIALTMLLIVLMPLAGCGAAEKIDEIQQEIVSLQTQAAEFQQEIDSLKSQAAEFQQEIDSLKSQAAEDKNEDTVLGPDEATNPAESPGETLDDPDAVSEATESGTADFLANQLES